MGKQQKQRTSTSNDAKTNLSPARGKTNQPQTRAVQTHQKKGGSLRVGQVQTPGAAIKVPAYKPPMSNPKIWVRDREDLKISYEPLSFAMMCSVFLKSRDEVAGLALIEDGQITWVSNRVFSGSPGGVRGEQYALLSSDCYEETGRVANVQFHSHPGLSTYWSATDERDQEETVIQLKEEEMAVGETYFMVIDRLSHKVRRIVWDDQGPEFFVGDAYVTINEQKLNFSSGIQTLTKPYTQVKKPSSKKKTVTGSHSAQPAPEEIPPIPWDGKEETFLEWLDGIEDPVIADRLLVAWLDIQETLVEPSEDEEAFPISPNEGQEGYPGYVPWWEREEHYGFE